MLIRVMIIGELMEGMDIRNIKKAEVMGLNNARIIDVYKSIGVSRKTRSKMVESNLKKIIEESTKYKWEDIISGNRGDELVTLRKIISKYLYERYSYSFADIARVLNRNHTTIMYNIRECKNLAEVNDHKYTQANEFFYNYADKIYNDKEY